VRPVNRKAATELKQADNLQQIAGRKSPEIEMAEEGTVEAELRCIVGNERARRFYERRGWK
jgi:hypothetical protein